MYSRENFVAAGQCFPKFGALKLLPAIPKIGRKDFVFIKRHIYTYIYVYIYIYIYWDFENAWVVYIGRGLTFYALINSASQKGVS